MSSGAPASPGSDSFLRGHSKGCSLAVRVQPSTKRTAITGIYNAEACPHLAIAIQAPPVEGKANAALIRFLAKLFSLPASRIEFLHGEQDRMKLLLLHGLSANDARERLMHAGAALDHLVGTA